MPLNAHALVIGVSQYQHIRPLPRVADAEDLAGVPRDLAACSYDPANVTLRQESEATRAGLLDEFDQIARCAVPDATALVYFSCHGGRSPDRGSSYLMPIDSAGGSATAVRCS